MIKIMAILPLLTIIMPAGKYFNQLVIMSFFCDRFLIILMWSSSL